MNGHQGLEEGSGAASQLALCQLINLVSIHDLQNVAEIVKRPDEVVEFVVHEVLIQWHYCLKLMRLE